jgi:hypothetical protein
VFETVNLQAIAHTRIRQRIIGVSAYFDYVRVVNTIDSQKSEDAKIRYYMGTGDLNPCTIQQYTSATDGQLDRT